MDIHPSGTPREHIDTLFKIHYFTLQLNIFFINFTKENCVNDKLHYNKTCMGSIALQDRLVINSEQMPFYQTNMLSLYISFIIFSFSSFHGLDVWSCGLQMARVTGTGSTGALGLVRIYREIYPSTLTPSHAALTHC